MNANQQTLTVRNPRTGNADLEITLFSKDELTAEAQCLRAGQKAWAAKSLQQRIAVLETWVGEIAKNRSAIVEAEAIDTGISPHKNHFVDVVIGNIRGWCKAAPKIIEASHYSGMSSNNPNIKLCSNTKPYALLGVISPWNVPLALSLMDAVPALLAGCAALIKPSEVTPRFVRPLMETIKAVPELSSVLSYVTGDGVAGQQLIDLVDVVCFTGSVPTGRKVAEQCARNFIPSFLELGGKDPVIVTASADIDRAATAILYGAAHHTGQICFSVERIYVHESIHDTFVDALVKKSNDVQLNYPDINSGDIGPFIFAKQAAIADAQIDEAVAKGANILCGGKSENLGGGFYMRPTVITNVTHEMVIMQEETFAPIMPVMKYSSETEAINMANSGQFGLSAAVIAGSEDEAARIGVQLEAGCISLQDTCLNVFRSRDIATNGFKFSGLGGSRSGAEAITRFFQKSALLTNTQSPKSLSSP